MSIRDKQNDVFLYKNNKFKNIKRKNRKTRLKNITKKSVRSQARTHALFNNDRFIQPNDA